MTKRKRIDWEACEADFRSATFSNCELAEKYGCGESAIRDRAKRYNWQKDLAEQVRKATEAKLLRTELRGPNAQPDAQIVENAATIRAEVQLRHRRDIAQQDDLKRRLSAKADTLIETVADLKSLTEATSAVESLSRTLSRLIPLERQAFNLDAPGDKGADGKVAFIIEN